MIYNLICDLIIKFMNYLIFLEFFKFIWIYFELKGIKFRFLSRADIAADVLWAKKASPCCGI